ncbi:rRNA maturation RNase YbeY, partial [Patescibacteria group bacterium]
MHEVTVTNLTKHRVLKKELEQAGRKILRRLNKQGSISVLIVMTAKITALNQRYRKRSGSTDVLSFDLSDDSEVAGEIVISWPEAQKLAHEKNKPVKNALLYLLIHGILHLAGFEHEGVAASRA